MIRVGSSLTSLRKFNPMTIGKWVLIHVNIDRLDLAFREREALVIFSQNGHERRRWRVQVFTVHSDCIVRWDANRLKLATINIVFPAIGTDRLCNVILCFIRSSE